MSRFDLPSIPYLVVTSRLGAAPDCVARNAHVVKKFVWSDAIQPKIHLISSGKALSKFWSRDQVVMGWAAADFSPSM
jgi:hypothetical protein